MNSHAKGVPCPNPAVHPAVLEVFRPQWIQAVFVGVGPDERIEPRHFVQRRTPQCRAQTVLTSRIVP
jgi:hypothetical protein